MAGRQVTKRIAGVLCGLVLLALCACEASDQPEDLFLRAEKAYTTGLYLESEKLYETYLQRYPQGENRWQAWNRLLEIVRIIKGDREKALALLEAMQLEFGSRPKMARNVLLMIGDINREAGNLTRAVEAWQRALAMPSESGDCELRLQLGSTLIVMGEYDLAADALSACTRPGAPTTCRHRCTLELAQAYGFLENWPKAEEILRVDLNDPGLSAEEQSVVAFMLADVLINIGEVEEAGELLRSIRQTHPNPLAVKAKLKQLPEK